MIQKSLAFNPKHQQDAEPESYSNPYHVIGIFPALCACLALADLILRGIRALLRHSNADVRVTLATSGL